MEKARSHDQGGAIAAYTKVIDLADSPTDIVAMAMFNRALAEIASGDFGKGVEDLTAVIDMDGAPPKVKKMAKQKLAKRINQNRHYKG